MCQISAIYAITSNTKIQINIIDNIKMNNANKTQTMKNFMQMILSNDENNSLSRTMWARCVSANTDDHNAEIYGVIEIIKIKCNKHK